MTKVVIMAGGRGLRLHPITEKTPKPMLRVGAKPLLEQIVERFTAQGHDEFVFCVNYLADLIRDYFGDGKAFGCRIHYVQEREPMGTGGALRLAEGWLDDAPFFVTNADVLTDLDYGAMLATHRDHQADATVALALHQQQIPFGVADTDGHKLIALREKPIEGFLVNAGVYVVSPRALEKAPGGPFDMPDLLALLDTVAIHPIEGYWCDVGTFEAMVRASQEWPR